MNKQKKIHGSLLKINAKMQMKMNPKFCSGQIF